jgi:hypothetical protein
MRTSWRINLPQVAGLIVPLDRSEGEFTLDEQLTQLLKGE